MINHQIFAADQDVRLIQRLCMSRPTPAVLTFAPVEPGSGCSWVVSRLGRALARHTTKSVCIVDASFRSPSQQHLFGINGQKGFADAILQNTPARPFACRINVGNLWVLPAGAAAGESNRILFSDSMRDRIYELRSAFDYLLIDTAAASSYVDASVLGKLSDGMVLVVAADSTRQQTAARAREELALAQVDVVGAILNKRTFPVPEAIYRVL